MKRDMLFVLLVLSTLSVTYAQGQNWGWQDGPPPPAMEGRDDRHNRGFPPLPLPQQPAEKVAVTGNLGIVQGIIALTENGVTYYTPDLFRYVGFIEGLKDGVRVTLEGQVVPANSQDGNSKTLRLSKLTIGSKDYDLAIAAPPPNAPNRPSGPPEPFRRNRD